MNVQLDPGAYMPEKHYREDAGFDLRTPKRFVLRAHSSIVIDTGVHIEVPYGCVAMVKSKSGLMCNKGITTDGTVDCGYSGSIRVCLFNHSGEHHIFEKGDKIAQLVIMLILNPEIELHQVAQVEARERGINGFGSTGK